QQKPPAGSPGGGLLLLFSQLPLLQAVLAGCQPLLLLEQASKVAGGGKPQLGSNVTDAFFRGEQQQMIHPH
ncbi:hypothetical protein AAAX97_00350, partial [Faecalibacterium duncaniae]